MICQKGMILIFACGKGLTGETFLSMEIKTFGTCTQAMQAPVGVGILFFLCILICVSIHSLPQTFIPPSRPQPLTMLKPISSSPTCVPTKYSTSLPTYLPTKSPTPLPAQAPVPMTPPTMAPLNAPTTNPTRAPSRTPTASMPTATCIQSANMCGVGGTMQCCAGLTCGRSGKTYTCKL